MKKSSLFHVIRKMNTPVLARFQTGVKLVNFIINLTNNSIIKCL